MAPMDCACQATGLICHKSLVFHSLASQLPPSDSQALLRHRELAGTVASFRTWRGSRRSLAQDPAIARWAIRPKC